jgi:cell division transport system permease protein
VSAGKKAKRQAAPAARLDEGGWFKRLRAWREQHAYSLVSSLGRFFRRPFATLLTVGVMAVAIALPLGLALSLQNVGRLSGTIDASRDVGVFLKVDITSEQAQRLAAELRARDDVAVVTVKTPEQGLAEFRAMSALAGALDTLDHNPLPTVLTVQPRDDGDAVAAMLAERGEVDQVQHDAVWRKRLDAWLAFGARLTWIVAIVLGLGVLLVVGNTVRLDIGARREEIGILQQLGATDGFVRRPFIYLGAWYGLASGALALGLLAAAGLLLQPRLDALVASYGSRFDLAGPGWPGALIVLAVATAIGWLGAWLATGHHLRQTRPTEL